jgi:hypothetical protein
MIMKRLLLITSDKKLFFIYVEFRVQQVIERQSKQHMVFTREKFILVWPKSSPW